jgi:Uma2 family endonuclease
MQRVVPISVTTWHRMIEEGMAAKRSELIRGVIIEKMPKSILHIQLVSLIDEMLRSLVPGGFWVREKSPITLSDSEPEPDISVVTGKLNDYTAHPTTAKLVVEVAVSTLAEDREMAAIYAEAAVDEYWLVNATERNIEVYRQPVAGKYAQVIICGLDTTLLSTALPEVSLHVGELFARLPEAKV